MIGFKRGLALAVLVGSTIAGLGAVRAQEGDQRVQLFIDRNQVYADAHYCFKTKEALAYFSNYSPRMRWG